MKVLTFVLSCLIFFPCHSEELDSFKAASWIQSQYYSAFKGTAKLDRARALEYVHSIQIACFLYDLDDERYFAQIAWESSFVNNIRDRKLAFHSWSYGLCGIQRDTAVLYVPKIEGRELIMNYQLNILLGAKHMRHLINMADGDVRKAEMAYNCGWNGMLEGKGRTYPMDLDTTVKKWKKFERGQK